MAIIFFWRCDAKVTYGLIDVSIPRGAQKDNLFLGEITGNMMGIPPNSNHEGHHMMEPQNNKYKHICTYTYHYIYVYTMIYIYIHIYVYI